MSQAELTAVRPSRRTVVHRWCNVRKGDEGDLIAFTLDDPVRENKVIVINTKTTLEHLNGTICLVNIIKELPRVAFGEIVRLEVKEPNGYGLAPSYAFCTRAGTFVPNGTLCAYVSSDLEDAQAAAAEHRQFIAATQTMTPETQECLSLTDMYEIAEKYGDRGLEFANALRAHNWEYRKSDDPAARAAGLEQVRQLAALQRELRAEGVAWEELWNDHAPAAVHV
jgi:hypothetical protein